MSINISKLHREELLGKIQQIRDYIAAAPQDANTGNLLQYLDELTKEINGKKYGLVFEQHREQIDEILDTHAPVLTEQKNLFINSGGEMNFLIEGDNLAALKLLEKTHKGKIDVIYIDPPYNTGAKNWKYNNDYVDKDDGYRHSKFISFMKERLEIAKRLLSKEGIIICAIDDYEIQNVRSIMDDIYGEQNRLGTVVVVHNPRGRNDDTFIATMHEYLLFYALDSDSASVGFFQMSENDRKAYNKNDAISAYNETSFIRTGNNSLRTERPGLWYEIFYNPQTDSLSLERETSNDILLLPINGKNEERCWRWGPETFLKQKNTELFVKKVKGKYKIYKKRRITDSEGRKPRTVWSDSKYDASSNGIILLQKMFGGNNPFPYPKSLYAVSDALFITSKSNSTILDFFAGSGTTGHAVMKLNAEDGGHRKFILCTNNENNICRDVTYQRLKTVITGKRKDGSEYDEHYNASLKYHKIDYVPIIDKVYYEYSDQLLLHIRELVELENGVNFNGNNDIAIVLNDEEMEQFVKKTENKTKVLYRGHDVLLTAEQEEYLKNRGIKVNVIPDYYYNELNR